MSTVRKDDAEQARIAFDCAMAIRAGDFDRARELAPQVQMEVGLLKSIKECHGAQYIRDLGVDTSLADEEFGPDWLDRDEGKPLFEIKCPI